MWTSKWHSKLCRMVLTLHSCQGFCWRLRLSHKAHCPLLNLFFHNRTAAPSAWSTSANSKQKNLFQTRRREWCYALWCLIYCYFEMFFDWLTPRRALKTAGSRWQNLNINAGGSLISLITIRGVLEERKNKIDVPLPLSIYSISLLTLLRAWCSSSCEFLRGEKKNRIK